MSLILAVCCVTGRIAGDGFACGDCDPCVEAHGVHPAIKRLLAERDEWMAKYESAMSELDEARAAMAGAQPPEPR